jgi:hypothetical protein
MREVRRMPPILHRVRVGGTLNKHEYRNPKSETNPKREAQMPQTPPLAGWSPTFALGNRTDAP